MYGRGWGVTWGSMGSFGRSMSFPPPLPLCSVALPRGWQSGAQRNRNQCPAWPWRCVLRRSFTNSTNSVRSPTRTNTLAYCTRWCAGSMSMPQGNRQVWHPDLYHSVFAVSHRFALCLCCDRAADSRASCVLVSGSRSAAPASGDMSGLAGAVHTIGAHALLCTVSDCRKRARGRGRSGLYAASPRRPNPIWGKSYCVETHVSPPYPIPPIPTACMPPGGANCAVAQTELTN